MASRVEFLISSGKPCVISRLIGMNSTYRLEMRNLFWISLIKVMPESNELRFFRKTLSSPSAFSKLPLDFEVSDSISKSAIFNSL